MKPPVLLPPADMARWLASPWFWIVIAIGAFYGLYRTVYRVFGTLITACTMAFLVIIGYIVAKVHQHVASWQQQVLHPVPTSLFTVAKGSPLQGLTAQTQTLNTTNPVVHENPWVIALVCVVGGVILVLYLIYRMLPAHQRAKWQSAFSWVSLDETQPIPKEDYPISPIELAVDRDTGKPIRIEGKDRFLNTALLGSIGTGKTSRILLKAIYQDLKAMAEGWQMDVIVVEPDGEFSEKAIQTARSFGLSVDIIDLRSDDEEDQTFLDSTVSFNPFGGGNIADILNNVQAALKEKMGKQEGFFQNAQDGLLRSVIQIQVSLWPQTDFLQFANLVTDIFHFRAICQMIQDCSSQETRNFKPSGKKSDPLDEFTAQWEHERADVVARFQALPPNTQNMVSAVARSFLIDTRNEQKLDQLEKITQGLKIVVGEIAYNPRLQNVLGTSRLPGLNLKELLNPEGPRPGRLVTVITGNQPEGKLFGKLFLVTLKMYTLRRKGNENTRRPVYLYVDEFAVYGTEAYTEMFSQARKYRVGQMLAYQARAQLLDVSKKFQDVVEGSCRNKIYFPSPSPDDAKFLEHALGSIRQVRETHSENKLGFFGFDNRNLDRKVSRTEAVDPRFRVEDLSYGLKANEAIFSITQNNEAQRPVVGITSYADDWLKQHPLKRSVQSSKRLEKWIPSTGHKASIQPSEMVVMKNASEPDTWPERIPIQPWKEQKSIPSKQSATTAGTTPVMPSFRKLTHQAIPQSEPQAIQRIDLKKQNAADETISFLQCPMCEKPLTLMERDGKEKWICESCGFQRKKR
ncbi:type IV secretory system conjugative DNA transfer family protein [Alicyclobacillus tolerans]|uniref:type IV secretory system conjugative DNA transfer family protein n=1 Tax=Alicyclobacillus tolerans TaxID=90970 RepID=UPI003B78C400